MINPTRFDIGRKVATKDTPPKVGTIQRIDNNSVCVKFAGTEIEAVQRANLEWVTA